MDQKLEWAKTLKVGDTVCDCRYKHLRIADIRDRRYVVYPWLIRQIIFSDYIPMFLTDWLDDAYSYLARKIGYTELADRDITLEDGSNCSAMHCCDNPHDHTLQQHPI